jgi:hypothetical protein
MTATGCLCVVIGCVAVFAVALCVLACVAGRGMWDYDGDQGPEDGDV